MRHPPRSKKRIVNARGRKRSLLLILVVILSAPGRRAGADDASVLNYELHLEHRSRFEQILYDYRPDSPPQVNALSTRTSVLGSISYGLAGATVEVLDSQIWATEDFALNASFANPLDVLQSYATLRLDHPANNVELLDLRVGRMTLNLGSRRLISRNNFRNTINAFTGLEGRVTFEDKHALRAFAVWPVQRRPDEDRALRAHRLELDREATGAPLLGAFYTAPELEHALSLEVYVFALLSGRQKLVTPGFRFYRASTPHQFDFELEVIPQVGAENQQLDAADEAPARSLRHRAFFGHLEAGWSFGGSLKPRLTMQYDYATGDRNPEDGTSGRFNTLFGSRGFELGPTGIYGPFGRSNISSPGVRLEATPLNRIRINLAYRAFWVEEARDAWVTVGYSDSDGAAGSFIGHHTEAQMKWLALPNTLTFDVGFAYLIPGDFVADVVPLAHDEVTRYLYAQGVVAF